MGTRYTKVVAIIDGNAEVLYLTDADLEKCRKRLGKEGCEDTSIGKTSTVGEIWNMPRMESVLKRKVLVMK